MSVLGELVARLLAPFRRASRGVQAGLEEIRRAATRSGPSWHEVASAAGLTELSDPHGVAWGSGSLRVELSSYLEETASGTRVRISGAGLPADVTLRPQRREDAGGGVREIEVGDPAFDSAAWVEGSPALVRSLLDAGTRRAMLGLLEGRLERPPRMPFAAEGRLEHGALCVDVPDFAGDSDLSKELLTPPRPRVDATGLPCACGSAQLPDVLRLLLAVARRLETPEDVPRRLAENLKTEPLAGVRRQGLTTLAREHPGDAATREALLAARADPDAEVRLRAATLLGPEGRDVVLAIARGEGAPDETTARAVAALAGDLSADEASALLRSALRTRREASALACLRVLGRRGGPAAVKAVAKVLAVETGLRRLPRRALATAAAKALGDTRDPSAEAPLLAALGSPSTIVRVAVAQALGRVGTTAAVLPLKELEARDASCRAAARQAVAEIQSRLTGAAPGQLSLAAGESGQLSLAEGERGELSLAGDSSGDGARRPRNGRGAG